jgi:hypothetical protein
VNADVSIRTFGFPDDTGPVETDYSGTQRMKTYEQINKRIEAGKAVVMTADEIADYADRKRAEAAAKEVDVVTTATFGPMCSSGCVLNFGHS